jgi:hypothetical protein
MSASAASASVRDPVNARILAVSEDQLAGFQEDPFAEIAARSGVPLPDVLARLRAMLEAGTIRRIRQTLLANQLAPGALVAWRLPGDRLDEAFRFLSREDPCSGHVVVRTTDADLPGAAFRLWTTLKVPAGFSLRKHAGWLAEQIGAEEFRLMPAKRLFALGVGHVRRQGLAPGTRVDAPVRTDPLELQRLSHEEWAVLRVLKKEFAPEEIRPDPWRARAAAAGLDYDMFVATARAFERRGLLGRFSTFLEHVKPTADGTRVTRYNALFHWRVPEGQEIDAGIEVARHVIVTHCYWREAGPEFGNVNLMAVVHGTEKATVLAHKAAIDDHLREAGVRILYTNVFWGGRSEIKPSEIDPVAYGDWLRSRGLDPEAMRPEPNERYGTA